jgi:hypothetical protein
VTFKKYTSPCTKLSAWSTHICYMTSTGSLRKTGPVKQSPNILMHTASRCFNSLVQRTGRKGTEETHRERYVRVSGKEKHRRKGANTRGTNDQTILERRERAHEMRTQRFGVYSYSYGTGRAVRFTGWYQPPTWHSNSHIYSCIQAIPVTGVSCEVRTSSTYIKVKLSP